MLVALPYTCQYLSSVCPSLCCLPVKNCVPNLETWQNNDRTVCVVAKGQVCKNGKYCAWAAERFPSFSKTSAVTEAGLNSANVFAIGSILLPGRFEVRPIFMKAVAVQQN